LLNALTDASIAVLVCGSERPPAEFVAGMIIPTLTLPLVAASGGRLNCHYR
jgi:hypothetical protein